MKQLVLFLLVAGLSASAQAARSTPMTELHWSICEPSAAAIFSKLGVKAKTPDKTREVSYFDTKPLKYYGQGLIVRHREDDSKLEATVKLEVASIQDIPADWWDEDGFKCEYDKRGSARSLKCSLEEEIEDGSLMSDLQREFVRDEFGPVPKKSEMVRHGSVEDTVWKKAASFDGKTLELERYVLPDGTQLFEISTRVTTSGSDQDFERLTEWLEKKALSLCVDQESKTRQVLNYFE